MFLLKALRKNPSLSFISSDGCQQSYLLLDLQTPLSNLCLCLHTAWSPICLYVYVQIYLFMLRLSHIGFMAHPNPIWPHLTMSIFDDYFQIRSHSQVPNGPEFVGDTIQPSMVRNHTGRETTPQLKLGYDVKTFRIKSLLPLHKKKKKLHCLYSTILESFLLFLMPF